MTNHYDKPYDLSAYQAKFEALKLSFAPVSFQITYALWKLNILQAVSDAGESGIAAPEIAEKTNISEYGVKVLLDMGLSCHLVYQHNNNYILDKIGLFILSDKMVQINFDFIQDVCYQGLHSLLESIQNTKPEGLKVFGEWETIYPALSSLPEQAKTSWFNFDHYYSDGAFSEVLPIIFNQQTNSLLDIGGNTGKWALQCLNYNSDVNVTIVDLAPQLKVAKENISKQNLENRFNGVAADLLQQEVDLPKDHDVIWMSQFLDCFSENEIITILKNVAKVMNENTRLYILELYWDRQDYESAAFSINATSIYFTALANGNSRMYHSKDMIKCLHQAGLYVKDDIDGLGAGHTLFMCQK